MSAAIGTLAQVPSLVNDQGRLIAGGTNLSRHAGKKTATPAVTAPVANFASTKQRAEAGNSDAQMALAQMYDSGNGVQQDYAVAFKWWLRAAEQGNAMAQHNVGVGYLSGIGIARDRKEALRWFTKAAEQGNLKAGEYAERLKQGESAVPLVVATGSLRAAPQTVRTKGSARYGQKEEIIAQVVAEYCAKHKYIPNYFVCVNYAAGVWYQLLGKNIRAKIRVGNLSETIGSIRQANHAWVMAEVSPGTWLAVEPQGQIVYPESDSHYYHGYDFSGDFEVRQYNTCLNAYKEAIQKYNDAVNDLNDYGARYNDGDWGAKGALTPAINSQRQRVNLRLAEVNEEKKNLLELIEKAAPTQ